MKKKIFLGQGYDNLCFRPFVILKIFNERIEIKISDRNYTFAPDEVKITNKLTFFPFSGFAIQFNYLNNGIPFFVRFYPFRIHRKSILKQFFRYGFKNIDVFNFNVNENNIY